MARIRVALPHAQSISEYEAYVRERIADLNIDEVCRYIENAIIAGMDTWIPVYLENIGMPTTVVYNGYYQARIFLRADELSMYAELCNNVREAKNKLIELLKIVPKLLR